MSFLMRAVSTDVGRTSGQGVSAEVQPRQPSEQTKIKKRLIAMEIADGIGKLFSTHPPIEERIAALQASA
jgi:Zn-dependent protease with chaperone function